MQFIENIMGDDKRRENDEGSAGVNVWRSLWMMFLDEGV
jgi:hypothetical protein